MLPPAGAAGRAAAPTGANRFDRAAPARLPLPLALIC